MLERKAQGGKKGMLDLTYKQGPAADKFGEGILFMLISLEFNACLTEILVEMGGIWTRHFECCIMNERWEIRGMHGNGSR